MDCHFVYLLFSDCSRCQTYAGIKTSRRPIASIASFETTWWCAPQHHAPAAVFRRGGPFNATDPVVDAAATQGSQLVEARVQAASQQETLAAALGHRGARQSNVASRRWTRGSTGRHGAPSGSTPPSMQSQESRRSARIRDHFKMKKRKGDAKTESVLIDIKSENTEECIARSD